MPSTDKEIHWCLTCQLNDCSDDCPMHRRNTAFDRRASNTAAYHAQRIGAERAGRLQPVVQHTQRASARHG